MGRRPRTKWLSGPLSTYCSQTIRFWRCMFESAQLLSSPWIRCPTEASARKNCLYVVLLLLLFSSTRYLFFVCALMNVVDESCWRKRPREGQAVSPQSWGEWFILDLLQGKSNNKTKTKQQFSEVQTILRSESMEDIVRVAEEERVDTLVVGSRGMGMIKRCVHCSFLELCFL